MRTIISKTENISSLKTVVFYKFSKFIPQTRMEDAGDNYSLISDSRAVKVLRLSSKNSSDLTNFARYEFKFNPEIGKYREYLFSNLLGKSERNYIREIGSSSSESGGESGIMQILESVSVPQATTDSSEECEDEYFGILTIDGHSVVLLDVPENIWKIEIYNNEISENSSSKGVFYNYDSFPLLPVNIKAVSEPVISIYLGPEADVINNPDSYYYESQLSSVKRTKSLDVLEYHNLVQEITSSEILWLLISGDSSVQSVNLSSEAWLKSLDPNRNLTSFSLRTDKFNVEKDTMGSWTYKDSSGKLLFDSTSETLLSTSNELKDTEIPILKNKLLRAEINQDRDIYSENTVYNLNSSVRYVGETWKSATPGNVYSNPEYSGTWIKEGTDFGESKYSTRVFISGIFRNAGGNLESSGVYGEIEPSGIYSTKKSMPLEIRVHQKVGYVFNQSVYILSQDMPTQPVLISASEYSVTYNSESHNSLIIFNNFDQTVTSLINDNKITSSNLYSLFLGFTKSSSTIRIDQIVGKDWPAKGGGKGIYSFSGQIENAPITLTIDGIEPGIKKDVYEISEGSRLVITRDPKMEENSLYSFLGWDYSTSKGISLDSDKIVIDSVDFQSIYIKANYESKKYTVRATSFELVDLDTYEVVSEYGQTAKMKFSKKDSSSDKKIEVRICSEDGVIDNNAIYSVSDPTPSSNDIGLLTILGIKKNYNVEFVYKE